MQVVLHAPPGTQGEHGLGVYDGRFLTSSVIQVLNKTDLVSNTDLEAAKSWLKDNDMIDMVLPTSARDGEGVDDVRNWALSQLPQGPSLYPKVSIFDQMHVSKLIGTLFLSLTIPPCNLTAGFDSQMTF